MKSTEDVAKEIEHALKAKHHHVRQFDGEIYSCIYYCGSHDDALETAKQIRKLGYHARIHDHVHDHPDERWDVYIGRYVLQGKEAG